MSIALRMASESSRPKGLNGRIVSLLPSGSGGGGARRGAGSRVCAFLWLLAVLFAPWARADSTVVLNEIMYHPAGTNEAALEWIELQNQMSVHVDLSGWRLDRAIHYTFPEGTVLAGGAFLVVAANPAELASARVTNLFGPFTGRLDNSGDTIQLLNNNGRLIDEVTYGVEKDWPVAPDGAGVSLARRARNLATADSSSWCASLELGGTPGRENFPASPPAAPLVFNEFSSSTNALFWVEILNISPSNFDVGGVVLARWGGTNRECVLPSRTLPPGGFLTLGKTDLGFGADPGDRLALFDASRERVFDACVAKREPRGRWPDGTGRWLHPSVPSPGASNTFAFRDELVINEIMFHHRELPAVAAVLSNTVLIAITNTWRYRADGVDLGSDWRLPGYDDRSWASGNGLFYNTIAPLAGPKNTWLALTNSRGERIITFYFRTQFRFEGGGSDISCSLHPMIDDGAVVYLNGVECFRFNLPKTNILYGTLANTNVGAPAFLGATNVSLASLVPGENTLAVEVHQVVPNSGDMAFGAELFALRQLSAAQPFQKSPESWIELLNRSSTSVDLAGWRLDGGISYQFAPGTSIAPGGYLVVARNVDCLRTNHPGINVVGPFTGTLSASSDLLVIRDPSGNPADEVRYYGGGHWPEYADGGGSSLELRDPRADNSVAEAWSASDESGKSTWQTYAWRGVAQPGQSGEPTLWHEIALCVVSGPSEVLLDDISVIESPSTAPRQLLQNGSFDNGSSAHWRFLGTHRRSRVEPEPGNPSNNVLHLIASGSGEYQGNQLETTLTNNTAIVDGREYEISFRARWLAGQSLLNARLYFNRLARTFQLGVPDLNGTPGTRNSTCVSNLGPTFRSLSHTPVVPNAGQPVLVSAEVTDPDGVASVSLKYSVRGGSWQTVPMTGSLTAASSTLYQAVVPGQSASSVVQLYLEARDGPGAPATFPARGTNSRALYVVQDNQALAGLPRNLRVVMTSADANWLLAGTNAVSNELLSCTLISEEREVFYDVGVRLKGSFVGRNVPYTGFDIYLQPDRLFRGVHSKIAFDRNVGGELLAKQIINHAGGLPGTCDDIVRFIAPVASYSGRAQLRLSAYDNDFLDAQFKNGSDGPLFEVEVLRYSTATLDGNAESPKLFAGPDGPNGYVNCDLQDWGEDKESYRWDYLLVNNRAADDFAPAMAVGKLFSLTGADLIQASPGILDVDEWLRIMACQTLVGPADNYFTGANKHNFRLYHRPEDGRVLYLPWDWDFAFCNPVNTSIYGSGNVTGLFTSLANQRAFLNHMHDILATTFHTAHLSRWATNYGTLMAQDVPSYLSYIEGRRSYALSQLPVGSLFAVTNHSGNNFACSNACLQLAGVAPISVRCVEVNGTAYPVTWTSLTNWAATIPLEAGANTLLVCGVDWRGNLVSNASDSIIVTNTGSAAFLPVVINEWMADNKAPGGVPDSPDGLFQDWIELFNPNTNAVNLSGFHLTDDMTAPDRWRIPTNVHIGARGFLLVWADGETNQNPVLGGTNVDLHAGFQLSKGGESIGLVAPDGVTPISSVTFGPQVQNVSQGLFPDGNTNAVHFMTNFTPRASNTLAPPRPPQVVSIVQSNQNVFLAWVCEPGRACQVQFKNDLAEPAWTPLGGPLASGGGSSVYADAIDSLPATRFYRVVMLP